MVFSLSKETDGWQIKHSGKKSAARQLRCFRACTVAAEAPLDASAYPFITVRGAAKKMEVVFTTAQRAIERLERLGIVKQSGDAKRDRVYCAKALLDILEEPAQLISAEGAEGT